ncbi:MAG: S53 family peptidase [Alphaproteobacteria bacterium]|nr:S53 family peptidase [Alphaproteobacteria bacterium]
MGRRGLSFTLLLATGMLSVGVNSVQAQSAFPNGQIVTPSSGIARPEDVGVRARTTIKLFIPAGGPTNITPPSPAQGVTPEEAPPLSGLYTWNTPASLACVYRLVPVQDESCNPYVVTQNPTNGSRAIAIVDAFDAPNAAADLAAFSAQFALLPTDFHKIYASTGSCSPGGTTPGYDHGWESEETLNIEWAHAMAPRARIYLVEAASDALTDLFTAVSVANQCLAANGGGEVSMSWGTDEFAGETALDGYFTRKGVVYFAGAGDGSSLLYPSASPNVVSVGGTSLVRNLLTWRGNLGDFQGEAVWSWGSAAGTGAGPSAYETRPHYQDSIKNVVGSARGAPDVAAVADPSTGVWIYRGGWYLVGGTSVATPIWAGIVNAAGRFSTSTVAELTQIYSKPFLFAEIPPGFSDISSGTCGMSATGVFDVYIATPGWDFCTGLGSPSGYFGK